MASPAQAAPPQVVDVPLALFGGMHTGVAPSDLPEGLSPDDQDMAYVPGETFSRPCLSKILNPSFGNVPVLYTKTYVQPNGDPLTLAMDANGNIYVEDVTNSPGTSTALATVAPGISAFSASAFGREYIALSDLLHGQWCPLQYDGEFLDRVTQDGPAVAPTCANVAPPTATIDNSGAGTSYDIASATPTDAVFTYNSNDLLIITYTTLTIVTTAPNAVSVSEVVALAGITPSTYDLPNATVSAVLNSTTFKVPFVTQSRAAGSGGTAVLQAPSLTRLNNVATAVTSAPHGFQAGWQVSIAMAANDIGGGIASVFRDGNGNVTLTTNDPHGCPIDAQINVTGVTDSSFDGAFSVASVPSPTTLTYAQGGTVATSSSGNLQDIWAGNFFIQSVPSTTSFTYANIGPNDLTNASGTATILGQISAGAHQVVVAYLTRQGAITRPSPPVTFYANGGQQMLISGLALGPANVVARVIGLTGAGGDNYFVIPTVPEVGGQIVGTSSIVEDNTSTSAIIDFNDNTLFDSIAIDQPGNDLFDQRVLAAPIGFYSYASRLACWGDYSKIENLLNMTLAGGNTLQTQGNSAGSGANDGSANTAWTNPSNAGATGSSYASVNLGATGVSQQLLCETFSFAALGIPKQIPCSFNYYLTGGGGGTLTHPYSSLSVQLLKAGAPIGTAVAVAIPTFNRGSSASPQSMTLTLDITGLVAADLANVAFGVQFQVNANGTAIDFFLQNVTLAPTTTTGIPLGWTTAGTTSPTGVLISSTLPGMYEQYQMVSAGGPMDCMIVQPAFEDDSGTFILSPSTGYLARLYANYSGGLSGNIVVDLYSPSQGYLGYAAIPLNNGPQAGFQIGTFNQNTPAVIPADTLLRIYLQNVTAAAVVTIGEVSLPYSQAPYTGPISFWSYTLNPEGFAQTTGLLGSADDPSDIRCFEIQRNVSLLHTGAGTHNFQDNDSEPNQWVVSNLSRSVGACSIRAADPGQFGTGDAAEDWAIVANQNGLYLFAGGDFWKISQELDQGDPSSPVVTWEDVNWAYQQNICVKNDPRRHRAYILAPVNGAVQPNICWVLDYKELDTSTDLAAAPSLKIGITGKMLSTDKTRKWTRWNISANCADILVRPENEKEMTFAGGTRNGNAYGNLYTLDSTKLTDDDYGQIFPYYTTYGFVNHELEQVLGLGTGRKLTKKICGFITGVGYVSIIPFVTSLQNPLPATTVRLLNADSNPANLQGSDLEWTVAVRGERQFFRIQVEPVPGETDVQLKIQKLIVSMTKDPVIYHRGSAV